MRAVMIGLASLTIATNAFAADFLRGTSYEPPPSQLGYDWSGVYIGGQASYSSNHYGLTKSTRPVLRNIFRQLVVEDEFKVSDMASLPTRDAEGSGFGGFIGYNSQWGDAVVGLELNYSRIGGGTTFSSDTIGRAFTTSNEFRNDVYIDSSASARLTDLASLRLRAGYAWGWIMPYGMVGVAAGRADAMRSATVHLTETDVSASALNLNDGIDPRPGGSINTTQTQTRSGQIVFGYMFGAGVDIGLLPNVFVRAEWEMAQLGAVLGIPITVNSFRVGAALKY